MDNLSHNENRAIMSLKKNQDLLISTVDKRGLIVLMKKSLHMQLNDDMWKDEKTFRQLTFNPTIKCQDHLYRLLQEGLTLGIVNPK